MGTLLEVTSDVRFWLEYEGRQFELPAGETLLGRGEQCDVILDDALVSRQHARVEVRDSARIVDAGSSNGVLLNGERIQSAALGDGDVIVIGAQRLLFRQGAGRRRDHSMAVTLHGVSSRTLVPPITQECATVARDPLDLIGAVVDKALALQKGAEAEKLLAGHLERVLASGATRSSASHEKCALYAVRLAQVTQKPRWVDYCFELYTPIREPLPEAVVEQLFSTVRRVSGVSRRVYRDYLMALEEVNGTMTPRQRFLAQRLAGLESVLR